MGPQFIVWLVLGIAVKHVIDTIGQLIDEREWRGLASLVLGIAAAVVGDFNVLGLLGDVAVAHIIGVIFTGIGIGGGASLIFDILKVGQQAVANGQ